MKLDPVPAPRKPLPVVRREAVSIATAAQLLDVHEMTVRRLIWSGELRAFRVKAAIRIHRAALQRYMDEHDVRRG